MLDTDEIKRRLREAIIDSGRTQAQIAKHFDVTEQAVSGWLRTGRIDKRRLPALADYLGVPWERFMPGGHQSPPDTPDLAPDERAMLDLWRGLNARDRRSVQAVAAALAQPDLKRSKGTS